MKNKTAPPAAEFIVPAFLASMAYFMLIVQLMYTIIKLIVHARYITRRRNLLTRSDAVVPATKLHAAIFILPGSAKSQEEKSVTRQQKEGLLTATLIFCLKTESVLPMA
jgi:hypothetical protein